MIIIFIFYKSIASRHEKIVSNISLMRFLKKLMLLRLLVLSGRNEDDVAMVSAPERHNDNDFNHSASEEVSEVKIA
jgi:hypothetical protein